MDYRTADLVDTWGDVLQVCGGVLNSYGGRSMFHGRVRTVQCFEDNFLVRRCLSEPEHADILVVDGGGSLRVALMGDMIAKLACDNGWAGIVIWGAVRDSATLATLDIGIRAAGTNPRKSAKTGAGLLDVPIQVGGVDFQPGGWLCCDEDGIIVGPPGFRPSSQIGT